MISEDELSGDEVWATRQRARNTKVGQETEINELMGSLDGFIY